MVAEQNREKIKVLIVDDEPLARERIRDLLAGDAEIGVIAEAENGRAALEKIAASLPDVLFLDIQMPHLDGFQMLNALGAECARQIPAIVFVTAYDSYALQAFEFYALDYLLKPFARERFAETLERAKAAVRRPPAAPPNSENNRVADLLEELARGKKKTLEWITVKKNERILLYRAADIQWIEASANYAQLQFAETRETIRETMDNLEKSLDAQTFIRIHRSTIVNVNFIKEVQLWFQNEYRIVMKNGKDFILTSRYRDAFMKFFKREI